MVQAGLTHAVLETTSHGLEQHRVDAAQFDLVVFTNITHEHLDQHGTFENYRAAKARLIQLLSMTMTKPNERPRQAVLNRDDPSFEYLSQLAGDSGISYGIQTEADVRAEALECTSSGIHFRAVGPGFRFPVSSPLLGKYNVSNCLAAIAAATCGLGLGADQVIAGISAMRGVPGRNERIDLGQDFIALVDFAHTPHALRVAIEAVRSISEKRVIAVFGSAGLRDREKRRMMAEVAAECADISILTAEDPRTEDLQEILEQMALGARSRGGIEGRTFFRVQDRGEAIRLAVSLAQKKDVVMVCGKGHEQSMCFGEIEYPWDDRTAMRSALAEHLGIKGPVMPYLPTREGP
jgi:UDP-N-acetylmuramoyl-L-alanyl-D-glutamate--2,6-diaminopimelate ligase